MNKEKNREVNLKIMSIESFLNFSVWETFLDFIYYIS